jgi:putative spermidine/putrescine transport system substrate-binding protein
MMPRRQCLAALGCGLGWAMPSARAVAQPAGRDLTIVSWGGAYQDAQREVFFRPWSQLRGQRILEETWDGGVALLRERIASGTNSWDLVQVEGEELLIGCEEGLFEPIDWDAIGGREQYVPQAVSECGVGAIQYAFVLAWDRARLTQAPRGWADLFDVQRFPGRRALRRGPKTTLEIALLGDGVAPADVYALLATDAGAARAFRRLDSIRSDLVWWERGSQPALWLASGEVALSSAYNGRIAAANLLDGHDLGVVWEQNLFALDSWAIMKGTPNRDRALDFLRFAGDATVQARLPARIPYGVTARAATGLLPNPIAAALPNAPQNARTALQIDDRFWLLHLDRLDARFTAWIAR